MANQLCSGYVHHSYLITHQMNRVQGIAGLLSSNITAPDAGNADQSNAQSISYHEDHHEDHNYQLEQVRDSTVSLDSP